jgi:hypothetical protein
MGWTVHKPSDCKLGKEHKDNQKKDRNKANPAVVTSVATATISPCYAALLATLANIKEELWFTPACIWNVLLACMAGPSNTGQQIMTYLFIKLLPMTIYVLCPLTHPTKNLATGIHKMAPWHLKGKTHIVQRKRVKRYTKPIRELQDKAKIKHFDLTSSQLFLPPLRLVVMLSLFSNVSWVCSKPPRKVSYKGTFGAPDQSDARCVVLTFGKCQH